eukprot:12039827-Ditylum_brightwellii.AAC.1
MSLNFDPSVAKSSYFHHQNCHAKGYKSSLAKLSNNVGSDNDESNIKAGDKGSVVKLTERVDHTWQQPNDGEKDNTNTNDATKNNKLPSKWDR